MATESRRYGLNAQLGSFLFLRYLNQRMASILAWMLIFPMITSSYCVHYSFFLLIITTKEIIQLVEMEIVFFVCLFYYFI